MSILLKSKIAVTSLACISIAAFAENSDNFTVNGTKTVSIPLTQNANTSSFDIESWTGVKVIKLMAITPTKKMIEKNKLAVANMFRSGGERDYSRGVIPFSQSPGAVDLGMANVPVLDQGHYGTCVTFSTTAALDARLQLGDYIDQQCTLALNKGLGNDYWNGASNATQILDPLRENGLVQKGACYSQYPDPDQAIDAATYQMNSNHDYSNQINYTYFGSASLSDIKSGLRAGHRFLIGFGLVPKDGDAISVNGFNVLINGSQSNGGLWACQQPSGRANYCGTPTAGHEVIVIGFDDKQQLLKIRNSWSSQIGDQGDYYMTYAYYNAMAADQTQLN